MATDADQTRYVVGVMTGTSIDGIDAALVHIQGAGLHLQARLLRHHSQSLGDIGPRLRAAAQQQPMTAAEFAKLAWAFGELHAEAIAQTVGDERIDLICIHGQTIFHQPPISWQLVNAAPIAAKFGCAVVSDLRQADLAAGGQGAPITPIADWILFRAADKRRAIVNLGGFCNITILPSQRAEAPLLPAELNDICGFDVCACNQILDAVAREALGMPFDSGGAAALRGCAKPQAAGTLFDTLKAQCGNRRSLGTGDEAMQWVQEQIRADVTGDDLAASGVDAIGRCIADAVRTHHVDELIVAGGGARNIALRQSLTAHAALPVLVSDDLGVPVEAREAMAFAILGALCADGVPITLPQVTGCTPPAPHAGMWTFAGHSSRGLARRG